MQDHPEQPPFARHKRYYVVLKIVVLVVAALAAANVLGVV